MLEFLVFFLLSVDALVLFNGMLLLRCSSHHSGGGPRYEAAAQIDVVLAARVPARARASENRQTTCEAA